MRARSPAPHDGRAAAAGTSVDALGIRSFVYRAARPFEADRLMGVLDAWPVPVKDVLELERSAGAAPTRARATGRGRS